MGLLRMLARGYLLNRLLGRHRTPPPPGYQPYGRYRAGSPRYPGRQRGRFGLFGPFPYYSTTTRRGARVSVGGCCLPIPLAILASAAAAVLLVLRRSVTTAGR